MHCRRPLSSIPGFAGRRIYLTGAASGIGPAAVAQLSAVDVRISDLADNGLLDSTLIVMAGEFGRTPKISLLPEHYKLPGRDHWGAVQTVFFAGGGVKGGSVIGSSDRIGGYPATAPQTPENEGKKGALR
jgi:uncharacterized protein (DUF1501 family)